MVQGVWGLGLRDSLPSPVAKRVKGVGLSNYVKKTRPPKAVEGPSSAATWVFPQIGGTPLNRIEPPPPPPPLQS